MTSRVAVSAANCTGRSRHLPFSDDDHGSTSIDKVGATRNIQGIVLIPVQGLALRPEFIWRNTHSNKFGLYMTCVDIQSSTSVQFIAARR